MSAALQTIHLRKRFGGLTATDDVSFTLAHGARHALIGPNGAGKTTFVNLLTGVLAANEGQVLLDGTDVTRLSQQDRARRGLGRTFQINQLFPAMTPVESIGLAVSERMGGGGDFWRGLGTRRDIVAEIVELCERFRLTDVMDHQTRSLPYGKQRLLEIAVALAGNPRVLLLDEPAAGVPEAERQELLDTLAALPKDVSIMLIEHDMDLVFSFADRISVLVNGALFADGTPAEVMADPRVRDVYLGGEHG
ncbi:ABC transporter ATP-binding protein [Haematobacter massiliensis]|uniref:Hemolysin III n=2 Tax=Haematobacter massiliensis TaxID=195105 RepID=A0A086Y6N2_9RHOB|nr:ABC transporter ATP-binding protein [Haematobacter massiliensis]KFI29932.1 hemolysin III [Haematobacter massiliensis]OWJ72930.1 ABC transporter ATP-binding protein [Haematobacter massiliensis]OWJ81409.1 ABC transporter ATP-binding protein [Haematobacter massiliensis]QBJ25439.1 ABC transporter ATP-binding protein [Haematobacter massiliensis]